MKANKLIFVLLISFIFISGCTERYIYVRDEKPVIPFPDRPKISKITEDDLTSLTPLVRDAIVKTVDELKIYSELLEQNIKTYNVWAEENNKKDGINFKLNE